MATNPIEHTGSTSRSIVPLVVARRALFRLLSAGAAGGVTLVSAPAGSGKTVLLRSWIEDTGLGDRAAWVSVERDERDAQRLWLTVVEQLRAAAGTDGFVEALTPAPAFDGDALVERLVSELGSLEEPVVLVIDDLHELRSPEARAQLVRLLGRRPPLLRVVLATRRDPQLGLHRLRLTGELTEARAADLRFTLGETRELLTVSGSALPDAAVQQLHGRTEGWAAGLRLAALSLANHPEPERFVAEFTGSERTVAEYLLAEVLERQPEEVRRLLLRTSILDWVNGSLADALTGGSGGERILQDLEDANAFVVSLDTGRTLFRYHHLFADLLRLELRRTDPGAIGALHRAAAGWHAEHGNLVEAVRHTQAAEDWGQAAGLLADHWVSLWLNGQMATVRALLRVFPAGTSADPELAPVRAAEQLELGTLDGAAACIAYGERHTAEVTGDRRDRLEVGLGITRLWLAQRRGDVGQAFDQLRRLHPPTFAETRIEAALGDEIRAVALMQLGIVETWSGQYDDAVRHLEEARALASRIGRPFIEILCLANLPLSKRSELDRGRWQCAEAIAMAEAHGWGTQPFIGIALVRMGAYTAGQCRFDDAERWLERAEHVLEPDLIPATGLLMFHARGMVHIGRARYEQALTDFRAAARLLDMLVTPHALTGPVRHFLVQMLLRQGQTDAARATLAALSTEERERGESRLALAALHLAEGKAQAALEALGPVLSGVAAVLGAFSFIHALLLEAVARDRLGEPRAAEAAVERALDLAEPNALLFPFLMVCPRGLLERHKRHSTAHAALLSDILDVLAGSALPAPDGDLPSLQEALSEGELRVLRYLPSNLSAPEIAAELYLSTSTVKTHLQHIYAKLDVHRRTEAVERARAVGLLGPSARHLR